MLSHTVPTLPEDWLPLEFCTLRENWVSGFRCSSGKKNLCMRMDTEGMGN